MKKNSLFKGVAMLGAISLLANTLLPGLAHATDFIAVTPNADIDNSEALNEVYNFVSYATDKETVYGTGSVKVLNKGTVVNVTENYKVDDENGFVGKEYYVKASEYTEGEKYDLYEGLSSEASEIKVEISNPSTSDNVTYYDFTSYGGETKWGNGKVEVKETGTVVKVVENYKLDSSNEFVGNSYYVDATTCKVNGDACLVYSDVEGEGAPTSAGFYVKIINGDDDNGYEFVSYADEKGNTKWGDGKVEVDTTFESETYKKITVSENYKLDEAYPAGFVNKEYVVGEEDEGGFYQLYELNGTDGGISVKIEASNSCEEGKTCYDFVSYNPDEKTTKRGDGKVEVEYGYTKVKVIENYAKDGDFENQKFVVYDTEYTERTRYPLYTTAGDAANIFVEILSGDNENGYDFVSYAGDGEDSAVWGNGKVGFVTGFTFVEVTENSVESFVGNKYVIYETELLDPDSFYELYETNGSSANIFVKIDAYTITFNSNGGSEIAGQVVAEGAKIKKPTNPEKEGYTFDKWYSDEALTKEWNFDSDTVNENVTLYAKWNQNQSSSSSSSSSSSRSSGGGGSSKSTTKTTTTTTGDTKTTTDTKATDTKTTTTVNTNDNTKTPAYNDKYSKEFNDAYQFAYKYGITTMDSIEKADMESPLTRIAMAKMLSQYAINVLGKTPDTTKVVPAFPDVTAQMDADYNNGVTLAYQLGIMGIGIDKFRPNDLVTRAEFATALSRLLFNTPDGEGAYYETHLAKLMEEKIITNNNPDLQELRGYVMIMLMRSAQS